MFVRNFLTIAAAALFVTAGAAVAQVQPAPPAAGAPAVPGARHHGGIRHLFSSLNLSADQQSRINAIFAKYRQQNQSVTDPAQRKANRTAQRDEIMGVLTPAQQAKFKSEIAAMRNRHDNEKREGAPEPGATPVH